MPKDPFKILGIDRSAEPDEIKRAFRKLAKKYHPDITGGADEKFRRILLAYQQLSGYMRGGVGEKEEFDFYMKVEIDRERDKVQDLFDDVRDGILTFLDIDAPEYLDLFIGLSRDKADSGGRLKLDLPLVRKCRSCMGFGMPFFMKCKKCGGTGEEEYTKAAFVDIPSGMDDGFRTRLLLDRLHLNVIFRIDERGSDK